MPCSSPYRGDLSGLYPAASKMSPIEAFETCLKIRIGEKRLRTPDKPGKEADKIFKGTEKMIKKLLKTNKNA